MNKNEILHTILNEEYGFRPNVLHNSLIYEVNQDKIINNIHIRKIIMKYDEYKMQTHLYLPNKKKNVKTFIFVLHEYAEETADKDMINNYHTLCKYVPIDYIISRGYGVMTVSTKDVVPDKKYSKKASIIKYLKTPRSSNTWGAIQAWSWACSKALDYLYTLKEEIDLNNVAIIGHSRGGKTALLTAAQDERFVMAVSSCSGNSGAALSRNNTGETIKDIVSNFPYWFCKNYRKYKSNEEYLPFDQHQLLGLIAPRYLYVLSATEDAWACPKNELLSCRYASDIFEKNNVPGLIAPNDIETDKSYNEGHIGYHCKTGNHSLELRDWKMIIDFFQKQRN